MKCANKLEKNGFFIFLVVVVLVILLSFSGLANSPPTISSLVLNTTDPITNDDNQNLTAYATTSDADSDSVKVIYNWLRNGTSITVLNMPFERVNGTNSSNAWDYSGHQNHGSDNGGIVWNRSGGYDSKGAYEFDGINDFISTTTAVDDNLGKGFTMAAWVKPYSNKDQTILANYDGNNGNAALRDGIQFRLNIDNSGLNNVSIVLTDSGGGNYLKRSTNPIIANGTWYHIATTWDGTFSASGFKIYVNGERVDVASNNAGTVNSFDQSGRAMEIGRFVALAGATGYMNGSIDEVIIFNRTLSAGQIYAMFANQSNTIASEETSVGDSWKVQATPNDGTEDGAMATSNSILIKAVEAFIDRSNSVEGTSVTVNESGRLTKASAQSALAQAGNVTRLNLSSSRSTGKWVGYVGTVSANLRIGIVSDILYNFGSASNEQIKSVLSSQDQNFDFGHLQAAAVSDADSAFGFNTGDIDSASTAFTGTQTISGVSNAPALGLLAYTSTGTVSTQLYNTTILADTASPALEADFAFAVPVVANQKDFRNNSEVDFELLAAVSNPNAPETYYFFLDVE